MAGYTKLAPEILQSSIWNEPAEIRIVWITLLAAKDQDGYVRGDARTISRLANVSFDVTERALTMFQQPDSNSHTPDNEGRRIATANGGFIVLNHLKYRELGMSEERREYWRKKQKEHRESVTVNDMSLTCHRQRVSASASASGIQKGIAKGKQTDDEWLADLATKFATLGVDVNEQRIKAETWISTKPGRKFSRKFFSNWLARCETKMQPTNSERQMSDHEVKEYMKARGADL
jgi:hypothetical protein